MGSLFYNLVWWANLKMKTLKKTCLFSSKDRPLHMPIHCSNIYVCFIASACEVANMFRNDGGLYVALMNHRKRALRGSSKLITVKRPTFSLPFDPPLLLQGCRKIHCSIHKFKWHPSTAHLKRILAIQKEKAIISAIGHTGRSVTLKCSTMRSVSFHCELIYFFDYCGKDVFLAAAYNVHKSIKRAMRSYSDKVERDFREGESARVWSGLRTITGLASKSPTLTNVSKTLADELNTFYPHFDNKDSSLRPLSSKQANNKCEPPPQVSRIYVRNVFKRPKT